jgi:hypothetical protein
MTPWQSCRACGRLKPGRHRTCFACGDSPAATAVMWLSILLVLVVALLAMLGDPARAETTPNNGRQSAETTPCNVNHGCQNTPDSVTTAAIACGATPWLVSELLHLEALAGVPIHLRGMTLAAACHESKFAPRVLAGAKRGDGGKARGMLQMWPWAQRYCGLGTPAQSGAGMHDPVRQAECWLGNVRRLVRRAKQACCADPWVSAWAWASSGAKGYRCRAPRHYSMLKRWQR